MGVQMNILHDLKRISQAMELLRGELDRLYDDLKGLKLKEEAKKE